MPLPDSLVALVLLLTGAPLLPQLWPRFGYERRPSLHGVLLKTDSSRRVGGWVGGRGGSSRTHPVAVTGHIPAVWSLPAGAVEAGAVSFAAGHGDVVPQEAPLRRGHRKGLVGVLLTDLPGRNCAQCSNSSVGTKENSAATGCREGWTRRERRSLVGCNDVELQRILPEEEMITSFQPHQAD